MQLAKKNTLVFVWDFSFSLAIPVASPRGTQKCRVLWWLRVSVHSFQALLMRFRLGHRRSGKNPAGARFSKIPITERTPEVVLFSFKREGGKKSESFSSYTLEPPEVTKM